MRRLFDSLDLTIKYDHRRRVGRVSITLAANGQRVRDSGPCALGATRTRDLLLRRQLLYPLSYQGSCRGAEVA